MSKPRKTSKAIDKIVEEAQKLHKELQGVGKPAAPEYKWKKTMSGAEVRAMLEKNGWGFTGQEGSHMNLVKHGRSVTVPNHKELKIGTLQSIKKRVAQIENEK
ncbi:MAG: type II toxin-antitoxin system HicA family toxin [Bacteroidia bacterium]